MAKHFLAWGKGNLACLAVWPYGNSRLQTPEAAETRKKQNRPWLHGFEARCTQNHGQALSCLVAWESFLLGSRGILVCLAVWPFGNSRLQTPEAAETRKKQNRPWLHGCEARCTQNHGQALSCLVAWESWHAWLTGLWKQHVKSGFRHQKQQKPEKKKKKLINLGCMGLKPGALTNFLA